MGGEAHRYLLYGLRVESTRSLPGLRPLEEDTRAVDVRFDFERGSEPAAAEGAGSLLSESPVVTVRRLEGGAWTSLRYAGGERFLLDREGTEVRILEAGASSPEDVYRFLLGSVAGLLLRRRGLQCLHGAVLARGDRALALVAPSGSGKSTLGAALLGEGCTLVSDDVLALKETAEGFLALPGVGRVRLWQDAADALLGRDAQEVPLGHSRPKRLWDLSHDRTRLRDTPCPLAAVYHLLPDADASEEPRLEPHVGADLLVALLANTYPNPEHYPLEPALRARELEVLGRLVETLPLRKVLYRRDLAGLEGLRRALVADFDALVGRAP